MPVVVRVVLASMVAAICLVVSAAWVGRELPDSWLGRLAQPGYALAQQDGGSADGALHGLSIGGPFTLVDQDGRQTTQARFAGRWMLIYFGYTTCPDICPTTLQTMATALSTLGAGAARIAPLFITVDPARDRPDVLARYTKLFDPRIVGLTGSAAQIADAERAFRVYAARADQPGSHSYLMDHTSFVYLMDPAGRLRALFDRDTTAPAMAARIARAMA